MIPAFVGIFLSVFILTALLGIIMRVIARKVGYVDNPDLERKQHAGSMPYGGGWAMMTAMVIVCAGIQLGIHLISPEVFPEYIRVHLNGIKERIGDLHMIAGAAVLLGLMGFVDDIKPVREIYKLIIGLGLAFLMWALGFRITAHFEWQWVGCVFTVLWITGISNSFNFLDNMDGLSAGVATVVSILFAIFGLQTGQLFIAGYFSIVAGLAAGFLVFNFPPAKMFMGDCGSLFLGFLIAVGAVVSTFYSGSADNHIMPLLVPLLILALPLFDTFSVITIRLKNKRSPFKGDRNHFSHRLMRLGMQPVAVVSTIYLVAAGVGMSALYLVRLDTVGSILALVQALCVFFIIVILERTAAR